MKAPASLLLIGLLALSGCANHYVMRLDNGMQITTPGKPQLKDNIFSYKDAKGEKHYIAASRVREVEPASLAAKEDKIKPSSPPAPPKSKRHWYYLWLF
jgi:hypothetical protein